ncbi:MAG: hypothetical protein GF347_04555 [Candidatus Moranbacteria bacterium]|nr:hypothetical protein [Candidatus Moranbacteria bacterium]
MSKRRNGGIISNRFKLISELSDFYSDSQDRFLKIELFFKEIAKRFDYSSIQTPVIENFALYEKLYAESPFFDKDRFVIFKTKGRKKTVLCLRNELSISMIRAYCENGLYKKLKPFRLFSFGDEYEIEPDSGHYFRKNKAVFQVFGRKDPVIEVQLIQFSEFVLNSLNFKGRYKLKINNIGCRKCRRPYVKALNNFLKTRSTQLCRDCKKFLKKSPFLVFNCKNVKCAKIYRRAPELLNSLCEECETDFRRLLKYLDGLGVDYELDSKFFDNFWISNKIVFKFVASDNKGKEKVLISANRRDEVIKKISSENTSINNLNFEIDNILADSVLEEGEDFRSEIKGRDNNYSNDNILFIIGLGDKGKQECMKLYFDLIRDDNRVIEFFGKDSMVSQLKRAEKSKARFALIIGQKEAIDDMVIIRDLQYGSQETVLRKDLFKRINKLL